ncbi:MAG: septation protein IspZ [Salinivirgaceae bacterium]|nr:septation protein IspZ [Salinivirgaceae bacterium]
MNKILLKLLPGLLPLFVFIIIDEIWGTKIGIIAAIIIGFVEAVFIYIKDKRIDKFILFDTLLIVFLGLISILLDSDVFFKLKPAIIGVIISLLLGVSAFSEKNLVLSMSKRYLKGIEFNEAQYKQLQSSLKVIFFIFLFHTGLVFYSVWFMSNEAWAFISGGLFYILFGIYFVVEFLRKKILFKRQALEECLPLVDEKGNIIGKASRSECHKNKELLHPVVHLHVLNNKGELYLQKRPLNKLIQPGKWDTSVGGHVAFGETIENSLQREAFEEIGIKEFKPVLVWKYIWKSELESEMVFCFVTKYNEPLYPSKDELDGGKFWKLSELKKMLYKGVLTPNFEQEFNYLTLHNTINKIAGKLP